jgi:hypothetical protein
VPTITSPTTTITTQPAGVAVRSAVKAGGSFQNHNDGVIVRSNVKAGRRGCPFFCVGGLAGLVG